MPSNFAIAANPSSLPSTGGTDQITVTCDLTPAENITVALAVVNPDGTQSQQATATVVRTGEAFPTIKLAGDPTIGPGDIVLSADLGTLAAGSGAGQFVLTV